jgi:glycosyltransferase involved in cell wall biosynthesis
MKVIVCTPTKNRRWAWDFSRACMDMQLRTPDLWVILDNSSTPAEDWSVAKDRPGVLYERVYEVRPIGWMRNRCLDIALAEGADVIVFWDDDDYYPPTRISSGIKPWRPTRTLTLPGPPRCFFS